MKDYHVVFEGINGFQKEEEMQFPQDMPPPSLYRREYEQLLPANPIELASMRVPFGDHLYVKDRCFRRRVSFYALGKNIVYYSEERC